MLRAGARSTMHGTDLVRLLGDDLAAYAPRRVPRLPGFVFAAVAVVVAPDADDLRIVLIGRPRRPGDRWSGDVAFPGGLATDSVEASIATARREAREEVGLELDAPIGMLSDRVTMAQGARRPLRVRPVVFAVPALPELRPDPREVAAIYVPTLHELHRAPEQTVERTIFGRTMRFPARNLGDHLFWGMTASLVLELERRIGRARSSAR